MAKTRPCEDSILTNHGVEVSDLVGVNKCDFRIPLTHEAVLGVHSSILWTCHSPQRRTQLSLADVEQLPPSFQLNLPDFSVAILDFGIFRGLSWITHVFPQGFLRGKDWQRALQVLIDLRGNGAANDVSYGAAISACESSEEWQTAIVLHTEACFVQYLEVVLFCFALHTHMLNVWYTFYLQLPSKLPKCR